VTRGQSSFRIAGFAIALGIAVACWVLTCAAWRFDRVASGVVPLDPREFPQLTLVVLGSAGAYPDPNRRGPALAVGAGREIALVDAGRDLAESLRATRIPVSQTGVVFLTSLQAENTVGLDDWAAAAGLAGESAPLQVYGPPGTAALAEAVSAELRATGGWSKGPPRLEAHEVEDGFGFSLGEVAVRAGALPGGPAPALAWRFEWQGRSALVSSVGWAPDALVAQARGVSLWVHEAVMLPTPEQAREQGLQVEPEALRREAALHTSLADVGGLAQRAGVAELLLMRLRPPPVFHLQITSVVDDSYDGRVIVAEDGDEITP
jgi:ribonuclease Z